MVGVYLQVGGNTTISRSWILVTFYLSHIKGVGEKPFLCFEKKFKSFKWFLPGTDWVNYLPAVFTNIKCFENRCVHFLAVFQWVLKKFPCFLCLVGYLGLLVRDKTSTRSLYCVTFLFSIISVMLLCLAQRPCNLG